MKKLIVGFLIIYAATVYADFSVTLDQSFLAIPGRYVFTLDIKNKKRDKEWEVIVANGKASIQSMGGLQSKGVSIKDNVIKIDSLWKKSPGLEIMTKYSTTFVVGTEANIGLEKTSKNYKVSVGEGLGVILAASEKTKVGQHCTYVITGGDLPDGNYTAKLKIPSASDKTYKFKVQAGMIASLLPDSDSTGKIQTAGGLNYLEINADDMCKKRRGKKAALGLGIGIPVAAGSLAVLKWNSTWMQKLGTQLKSLEPLLGLNTEIIPYSLGKFIDFTAFQAFSRAGAQAISKTSEAALQAIKGKEIQQGDIQKILQGSSMIKQPVSVDKREATLQITYDVGNWQGDKAARFDYTECNNNLFVLFKSDRKINITG